MDKIVPGDVVQFGLTVRLEHTDSTSSYEEIYPQHTAIVYAVKGKQITLIHQNVKFVKKVVVTSINLDDLKAGTLYAYRPATALTSRGQAGMVAGCCMLVKRPHCPWIRWQGRDSMWSIIFSSPATWPLLAWICLLGLIFTIARPHNTPIGPANIEQRFSWKWLLPPPEELRPLMREAACRPGFVQAVLHSCRAEIEARFSSGIRRIHDES